MEPHVPYIIAMPNHDRYFEEYRLNGWVTFEGENVEISSETLKPDAVSGSSFMLQPTYEPVKQSVKRKGCAICTSFSFGVNNV